MIIDKIENIKKYKGLSENLDRAIESIVKKEYLQGKPGKNIIYDNEVFFNYDIVNTREEKDSFYEIHKKYIDIQIPINSDENYGFSFSVDGMEVKEAYNVEKDYAFYNGKVENKVKLTSKDFIIFFQEEPHMPLLMVDNKKKIQKVIYKIKIK
ncbi:YhcH/YjgK/YiaL family protein [Fusobacterium sp. IOR10]|uniref:YhcH/YjgK/YiaL family protein n=1 Tax=Fusobacterium sp. IOR10 TaxID=2665157 RepID=UPI0013CFE92B|nr:YhcH/YjgK/YiaL family protein [Fusobacterium sp. IOR10]